jgi:histidinol-phosphate aminotransferase
VAAYVGGESTIPGVSRVVKLASNESALGPSPRAVEVMRAAAASVHRYPDGSCVALRQALAERFDLNPDRIVCGAGSDDLITLLVRAYAGPSDEVIYTQHGFLMFPIAATAVGAVPVAAPERGITADVDALLDRISPRTRVVLLANPNNPTGTYLPLSEIQRLRDRLPEHVLLVLDGAYAEYIDRADYNVGFRLVDGGENVVVTRTFSKIYGLGGVRLGWAYGPASVTDVLNRLRNPFNVSSIAQAAGIAALADTAFVDRAKAHNDAWRGWTRTKLTALGLNVPESFCNFLLVRFPKQAGRDAQAADAFLRSRGFIARRLETYHLPDALRISIGLEDEMRGLVEALRDFVPAGRG